VGLVEALDKLTLAIRELSFVEQDLLQAKKDSYFRAQGSSMAQRDREVQLACTELEIERLRLRAELECARAAFEVAKLGADV
jgi:hypothetical protein